VSNDEYLRRNLEVSKAHGVRSSIEFCIRMLEDQRRSPRWLMKQLYAMRERMEDIPSELAKWRDHGR
jgi:hypothetical protein